MAGFAISGGSSSSKQGSNQSSSSFGSSSSSSGQFYDRLGNQIRQGLSNQFFAPGANSGVNFQFGGGTGGTGPQMTPDQVRAQNSSYNDRIQQMNIAERQKQAASQGLNGPQITTGPVYSQQMTNQELNRQQAQNDAATQGMLARMPQQLAGRGFASNNSPLMMEMQRRSLQQNQATNADLGTKFRFDTAAQNAQQQLASQSAAQGFFRQMQDEAIKRQEANNQARGISTNLQIAQLGNDTSRYNALLNAIAGLASPLQRAKSASQQGSQSLGTSFGTSKSQQSSVSPFDFGDTSVA